MIITILQHMPHWALVLLAGFAHILQTWPWAFGIAADVPVAYLGWRFVMRPAIARVAREEARRVFAEMSAQPPSSVHQLFPPRRPDVQLADRAAAYRAMNP
jgi:hypothetical protein